MKRVSKSILFISVLTYFSLFAISTSVWAGDDPSIKGSLREGIKAGMKSYIDNRMVSGTFYIYDSVDGKLMRLKFLKLHEGIVKRGGFYVSCADFLDERGQKVDLDFLVLPDGDSLKTVQAVIHSIDGKKRKYHLES
jgi:hypothetical protein